MLEILIFALKISAVFCAIVILLFIATVFIRIAYEMITDK